MTLANAHSLFTGLRTDPSFLARLAISDSERAQLLDAQRQIRAALKAATNLIQLKDEYWEGYLNASANRSRRPSIKIKFMTQGSFAYKTLNDPAQKPFQEIDLDDGMYVPVEFLDDQSPALSAKGLFEFVDAVLTPLCAANGWVLDQNKDCCARVKLWSGAHIDIPIYSIPSDRFETINEELAKSFASADMLSHDGVRGSWRLPADRIMLAHRTGTWKQSDPQSMHDWVKGRVDRYGPVYLRLCRFFKGWRDHCWVNSPLSSICLMQAIDLALRKLDALPTENRDDELILEIARHLPDILSGIIPNPVIPDVCINEWEEDARKTIVDGAIALREKMITALEQTGDAERVVSKLQDNFGERLPYRPDVIKFTSEIEAIERAPAAKVAAPRIIASTSG